MPSTTLGSSHLRLVTTIIPYLLLTTMRTDLEKNQVWYGMV